MTKKKKLTPQGRFNKQSDFMGRLPKEARALIEKAQVEANQLVYDEMLLRAEDLADGDERHRCLILSFAASELVEVLTDFGWTRQQVVEGLMETD